MSHKTFEKIKKLLDEKNIHYVLETHENVFTSEQAARARGRPVEEGLRRGAKAMVLKVDDEFMQFVVPANLRVDMKKVRVLFRPKKLRLATPEEVLKLVDCEPGSVPPFANLYDLKVFADPRIAQEIDFNAGLHGVSMTISKKSWESVVHPTYIDIGSE